MVEFVQKETYSMDDLLNIMRLLRSENGCPWDRVQTHESIRMNFLEETYEVLEAIDAKNPVMLREELGDVLLQVVFHSRMEEEAGAFSFADVVDEVCKKLVVRHPHVFGTVEADTAEQVLDNWDKIKQQTKGQSTVADTLDSVPKVFPALMRAQKVSHRAAKGEDYTPDVDDASRRISEALQQPNSNEAVGEMLLACAEIAEANGFDAEEALTRKTDAFVEEIRENEK